MYGWPNAQAPVREQVLRVAEGMRRALGDNLQGLYLHGSLAMGCFNPARSDIDLLAVTGAPASAGARRAMAELLLAESGKPNPVEVSVVTRGPWRHPAPYDFHFSEMHRETLRSVLDSPSWADWLMAQRFDRDLAAHVTVIRERGIALQGALSREAFAPVLREHYVDALLYDVGDAADRIGENPVYYVLNLARVLGFLLEGRVLSKEEGGLWAVGALPPEHRAVAAQALTAYRGADGAFAPEALAHYAAHVGARIRALTAAR